MASELEMRPLYVRVDYTKGVLHTIDIDIHFKSVYLGHNFPNYTCINELMLSHHCAPPL